MSVSLDTPFTTSCRQEALAPVRADKENEMERVSEEGGVKERRVEGGGGGGGGGKHFVALLAETRARVCVRASARVCVREGEASLRSLRVSAAQLLGRDGGGGPEEGIC